MNKFLWKATLFSLYDSMGKLVHRSTGEVGRFYSREPKHRRHLASASIDNGGIIEV
jgi:hypothetical protein